MRNQPVKLLSPVLFIPHGGGPLPLLGDINHQVLVDFLTTLTPTLRRPSAIIVISAHWEESSVTLTNGKRPPLIYDYSGFPDEAYQIKYPTLGSPDLANKIACLLQQAGIEVQLDKQRGFDHGLFVPLKILFPDALIPCVQLSLLNHLDPETHIKIGKALSDLRQENITIIGSGFSFHNMQAFFAHSENTEDTKNDAFQQWLIETCTDASISESERESRLIQWHNAPYARYCHPREDHLMPLHVCYGITGTAAKLVFNDRILGKRSCAFWWG